MHALTSLLLLASAALYGAGVLRLWRRGGRGRGITYANTACFATGWLVVAMALLSPLHHLAERLLWAHMVQHELLMVVAAPLLVVGRPVEAWRHVVAFRIPKICSDPFFAWALQAAAIWAWHAPALFAAAAGNAWLHLAQHTGFFVPAAVFWWTVLAPAARPLPALLSLFATLLHTGALGALMTFSRAPWYEGFALEDQQMAGLVMWVPGSLAYLVGALALLWRLTCPTTAVSRFP
jgi:putative membrane protein